MTLHRKTRLIDFSVFRRFKLFENAFETLSKLGFKGLKPFANPWKPFEALRNSFETIHKRFQNPFETLRKPFETLLKLLWNPLETSGKPLKSRETPFKPFTNGFESFQETLWNFYGTLVNVNASKTKDAVEKLWKQFFRIKILKT